MNTQSASNANVAASAAAASCYHCDLPVAENTPYSVLVANIKHPLCCPACQAVAETIVGSGLGNYYRYRDSTAARPAAAGEFAHLDRHEFNQRCVTALADGILQCELSIGGMHCTACVWLLEQRLLRLPGVVGVDIDFDAQRGSVRWRKGQQQLSVICSTIAAIGYQPQPYSYDRSEQLRQREQQQALRRLGVAGIGMMQVGMLALGLYAGALDGIEPLYRDLLRWSSLIVAIPVLLYAGQPFFIGAWRGLRARQPGMDVPVALALFLAFTASAWATLRNNGEVYFDSVTMFIFLLLGSRYLEMRARHYRNTLSSDFFSLLPQAVIKVVDGVPQLVPIEQLLIGDLVMVRSGEVIPADGYLLDAHCRVNEAALNGEYMPVHKQSGASLLAGSVNSDQPFTMRVSAIGAQLRIAAIHAITRQAQNWKPRLAQLADRLSAKFVLVILSVAALAYFAWYWLDPQRAFWIALSVLVVSCPCALSLATPLAITNATNALRRCGLLVTRANAWEQLPQITDIVFDKTGTLSEGRISIIAIEACGARSTAICRDIAASLEVASTHPIASAFAAGNILPALDCQHHSGKGVEGYVGGRHYRLGAADFALQICPKYLNQHGVMERVGHWILLADSSGPVCWFRLQDRLRDDAASALAVMRKRGLQLHILSGDRSDSALELAEQLHINNVCSGATPEEKLTYVQLLQSAGKRVLMVGDGINDIPVLAAADVSVAMADASQLAKTNADCMLLANRLDRLLLLLDGAAKTQSIIRQNLYWALIYNALAIPLAAMGLIAPWLAAVGMSLSSLLVTVNALRLNTLSLQKTRTPAAVALQADIEQLGSR